MRLASPTGAGSSSTVPPAAFNNNRVLPGFFDLNDRNAGIDTINHFNTSGVKTELLHFLDSELTKGIVADRTDETNIAAKLCHRDRLIGTFATKTNAVAGRVKCLAGTRQCCHTGADIDVHAAENENFQWSSPRLQLPPNITSVAGNFHATEHTIHKYGKPE
jgi:hypothetical protein